MVDLLLKVNAQGYSVEMANVRHEHEWKVWSETRLPDGKLLIPGVVTSSIPTLSPIVLSALAVAPLSAEAKKLMVVMNAATSIITTKSRYIVRSSLTLSQNCEVLGTWAFQNGVKTVFSMVSDYAPGVDAEAAFQRAYTAAGGQIIGWVRVPLANPDFSAFVQRAKDSGADGIFVFVPGG